MSAARCAIGDYCYMKSINYILGKCKWMSRNKIIKCASIKLVNNILCTKTPKVLFDLYKVGRRSTVNTVTIYKPKTKKTESFFLYKGLSQLNQLPKNIKIAKNFKSEIKSYIMNSKPNDTCD